ncbi:MAG: Hpt domain-containing protein [Proteobacteria bacterium]|nr:MAG: Hpt domain-containing protein [Pseudomonadota bacterium]
MVDSKRSDKTPSSQAKELLKAACEASVLDEETLSVLRGLERPGDSVSFLNDVIDTYVAEAPEILSSLLKAIRANKLSSVVHFSHQLKGQSGNIGVTKLSAICDLLEEHAESTLALGPEMIISLLNQAYDEAIRELQNDWKR